MIFTRVQPLRFASSKSTIDAMTDELRQIQKNWWIEPKPRSSA